MNPNDATNEELRDWLAEHSLGYTKKNGRWYHPVYHKLGSGQKRHPIPNTIDAAAKCLPEGCEWDMRDKLWRAWETHGEVGVRREVGVWRTADEATDRFRLAVKAIMAMEDGK